MFSIDCKPWFFISSKVFHVKIQCYLSFSLTLPFDLFSFFYIIGYLGIYVEWKKYELDRILQNIIDEHKESKTTTETGKQEANEDLVDILLKLQKHGNFGFPLIDNNIKAIILNIFGGGGETSSIAIEWAM
ncbi:unnamed protein product, partial [Vitis vinifera]|uniref:Uncharacterized protein n=1 Tax=Vitis vinifera TaxID=29760 RepID=D7SR83_VITVI